MLLQAPLCYIINEKQIGNEIKLFVVKLIVLLLVGCWCENSCHWKVRDFSHRLRNSEKTGSKLCEEGFANSNFLSSRR